MIFFEYLVTKKRRLYRRLSVFELLINIYLFATILYRNNKRTDPPIATKKLEKLNPVTSTPKSIDPSQPPSIAPRIPMIIVIIHPPGSFPGWIAFAMAPAISPKIIQVKIPIV